MDIVEDYLEKFLYPVSCLKVDDANITIKCFLLHLAISHVLAKKESIEYWIMSALYFFSSSDFDKNPTCAMLQSKAENISLDQTSIKSLLGLSFEVSVTAGTGLVPLKLC